MEDKTLEELEALYDKAVRRGDEILADTIAYLIGERQLKLTEPCS
jgi:hypothetical protein